MTKQGCSTLSVCRQCGQAFTDDAGDHPQAHLNPHVCKPCYFGVTDSTPVPTMAPNGRWSGKEDVA